MINPSELHAQSIVIDGAAPLLWDPKYLEAYRQGGVTAVSATVDDATEGAPETLKKLGRWLHRFSVDPTLILIRRAADILEAKRSGRLGVILHFQGGHPIENNLDLIDAYKALGVGMIQLTYNVKNRIGDGCEERTDAGLSKFGMSVIRRLNEARIVVDCSHTGYRTTMEAIEASTRPVVFSHAGVRSVLPSSRNIVDEQIKAVAATGGLVGAVAYPPFISKAKKPTMDDFVAHVKYMVDLVGIDHVGLGLDYFPGQSPYVSDADAQLQYEEFIADGRWTVGAYPPPPYHYPQGIETPDKLANVTAGLLERGFAADEVQKITGGNWLRVFGVVWGE